MASLLTDWLTNKTVTPDATDATRAFFERIHNRQCPHSSLGYQPPAEFEPNLLPQGAAVQWPQRLGADPPMAVVAVRQGDMHRIAWRGSEAC